MKSCVKSSTSQLFENITDSWPGPLHQGTSFKNGTETVQKATERDMRLLIEQKSVLLKKNWKKTLQVPDIGSEFKSMPKDKNELN